MSVLGRASFWVNKAARYGSPLLRSLIDARFEIMKTDMAMSVRTPLGLSKKVGGKRMRGYDELAVLEEFTPKSNWTSTR
jgi:hypothetical protein